MNTERTEMPLTCPWHSATPLSPWRKHSSLLCQQCSLLISNVPSAPTTAKAPTSAINTDLLVTSVGTLHRYQRLFTARTCFQQCSAGTREYRADPRTLPPPAPRTVALPGGSASLPAPAGPRRRCPRPSMDPRGRARTPAPPRPPQGQGATCRPRPAPAKRSSPAAWHPPGASVPAVGCRPGGGWKKKNLSVRLTLSIYRNRRMVLKMEAWVYQVGSQKRKGTTALGRTGNFPLPRRVAKRGLRAGKGAKASMLSAARFFPWLLGGLFSRLSESCRGSSGICTSVCKYTSGTHRGVRSPTASAQLKCHMPVVPQQCQYSIPKCSDPDAS